MYAVIMTGGKQYRVEKGQVLKLEKLTTAAGESVEFDKVLMVADDGKVAVGAPFLKDGKVTATVVDHGRADKIRIIKFRRRKHYDKQMGHRQHFTAVKITDIQA